MINYTGKDKTIKNIHDKLNKIEWIMKYKKPIPKDTDPITDDWMEMLKNAGMGNGFTFN